VVLHVGQVKKINFFFTIFLVNIYLTFDKHDDFDNLGALAACYILSDSTYTWITWINKILLILY